MTLMPVGKGTILRSYIGKFVDTKYVNFVRGRGTDDKMIFFINKSNSTHVCTCSLEKSLYNDTYK